MRSLKLLLIVALLSAVESKKGWHKHKDHWMKHKENYYNHNKDEEKENGNNNNDLNPFRQISDDPEQAFKDLAKSVTAVEQLSSKYCEKNSHDGVTEMYGTKNYKIFVPLKNLDTDLIEIKIRNRVVYIKGEVPEINPRWSPDDDAHFNDIKILPGILDVKKATWMMRNERIEVTIPYKFTINTEIKTTCPSNVARDEEILVREGKSSADSEIDQSVIDEIFGGKQKLKR